MQAWQKDHPTIGILGIIPGNAQLITSLAIQDDLRFPLISDPQYHWHQWMGLGRFSLKAFLRPSVIAKYILGILKGRLISKTGPDADLMRQGGELLLTKEGKPLWAFRSQNPTNRPDLKELTKITNIQAT